LNEGILPLNDLPEQTTLAIVGPCGAGKTSLADSLQDLGINARQIAQEHSFAPAMWQKMTKPDFLIYLDVSYTVSTNRKQFTWTEEEFSEQIRRLRHARDHCDIYVHTDHLSPGQVLEQVLIELDVGHLIPSDV
jgi:ABC-type glutathione transport system ATPase component